MSDTKPEGDAMGELAMSIGELANKMVATLRGTSIGTYMAKCHDGSTVTVRLARLPPLEHSVLQLVADGADPWRGQANTTNSRGASQALHRLLKRRLVEQHPSEGTSSRYTITVTGRAILLDGSTDK